MKPWRGHEMEEATSDTRKTFGPEVHRGGAWTLVVRGGGAAADSTMMRATVVEAMEHGTYTYACYITILSEESHIFVTRWLMIQATERLTK